MEKLADGLQRLGEDDLLQVVQMVHDNKSSDTYTKNDVESKFQRYLTFPIQLPISFLQFRLQNVTDDRHQMASSMLISTLCRILSSSCSGISRHKGRICKEGDGRVTGAKAEMENKKHEMKPPFAPAQSSVRMFDLYPKSHHHLVFQQSRKSSRSHRPGCLINRPFAYALVSG